MVVASSAPQPFSASATLSPSGGGGGGGGLSNESDEVLLIDEGNSDTVFLRRYVKDDSGVISGTVDTQLDGSTPYVATGPAAPFAPAQAAFTGLTGEADEVLLLDDDSNTAFIRRYLKDAAGAISATADFELDGSTPYVLVGSAIPAGVQPTALGSAPNVVVTYTRLQNASTTITAGALAVQYVVIADGVTVEGVAVPANVAVTHEVEGATTDSLAFDATGSGTGDVLIIEERAA